MVFSPLFVVSLWVRGLIAVALIAAGAYLWHEWYERSHVRRDDGRVEDRRADPAAPHRFEPRFGRNAPTAMFAGAAALALWSLGGGLFLSRRLLSEPHTDKRGGGAGPAPTAQRYSHRRPMGEERRVPRPDGAGGEIQVETDAAAARPSAPYIVFVHGWGADAAEWNVVRPDLGDVAHVVAWDLPGLGRSDLPAGKDVSLERMAADLRAVIDAAAPAGTRVVLVGHSIGAMTLLELCRSHPDVLGRKVAGLVLAHGTYTNPLRTMRGAAAYAVLQKPVIEPLLKASVALSPVLRMFAWLSYLNGSVHRSNHRSGFSGRESRRQLDFAARFALKASPGVLARGALGMLNWDAADVLPAVGVPVLVVAGGRDRTTKPEASEEMRRRIDGAELFTWPEAKHLGPVEFSVEFADRVWEFAGRVLKAPAQPRPAGHAPAAAPAATPASAHPGQYEDRTPGADRGAARPAPAPAPPGSGTA